MLNPIREGFVQQLVKTGQFGLIYMKATQKFVCDVFRDSSDALFVVCCCSVCMLYVY